MNYLSLAYNNLNNLPNEIIDVTKNTLEYLSLTGNKFSFPKESEEESDEGRRGRIVVC